MSTNIIFCRIQKMPTSRSVELHLANHRALFSIVSIDRFYEQILSQCITFNNAEHENLYKHCIIINSESSVGTNSPALPAKRGCRGWQSRVKSGSE